MSLTNDISKLMSQKNYALACNGQTEVADCMKEKGLSAASHTKYKTALAALHISTLKELSEHDGRKIFFVTKAERRKIAASPFLQKSKCWRMWLLN